MREPGFAAVVLLGRSRRLVMGGRHPLQDIMQDAPPVEWGHCDKGGYAAFRARSSVNGCLFYALMILV